MVDFAVETRLERCARRYISKLMSSEFLSTGSSPTVSGTEVERLLRITYKDAFRAGRKEGKRVK